MPNIRRSNSNSLLNKILRPDPSRMALMPLNAIGLRPRQDNLDTIRNLCRTAYLGGSDSLIRAMGRYKMYVDTTDVGISSHLLLDGYWEIWVTEAIVSLVKPGMIVADVGANLGYFTMIMADLVGPEGKVHAFEPNPAMLSRLRRNVTVNGFDRNTTVHPIALADRNGAVVNFVIPTEFPGGGTISRGNSGAQDRTIEVATARLDSRDDWRTIELMKVDVEGAEELVWRGAQGLLDCGALRTVLLEFNTDRYSQPADFLQTLNRAGFSLGVIHPDDGIIAVTPAALVEQLANQEVMLLLQR